MILDSHPSVGLLYLFNSGISGDAKDLIGIESSYVVHALYFLEYGPNHPDEPDEQDWSDLFAGQLPSAAWTLGFPRQVLLAV